MPKTLVLDIETSPARADVWKLWDNNVGLSQLREVSHVISFAAKWHGKKPIMFHSDFHDGHEAMIQRAHALMDEADIVVTYNGNSFDLKHLRREFLLAGMKPPSPTQSIDLLLVAKKEFRFLSNKLAHVTEQLGLTGKLSHSGHELWQKCMANDEKAWATMRRYNRQDVLTTDELYSKLKPWISNHPSVGLIDGKEDPSCPKCQGTDLQSRGWAFTQTSQYKRYQCQGCGGWVRGTRRERGTMVRGA